MNAMSISNRTIYDCNLFQKGPNMIAIIANLFSRDSFRNHGHVIQRLIFDIAVVFGRF